jgi:hypothetical protein
MTHAEINESNNQTKSSADGGEGKLAQGRREIKIAFRCEEGIS